MSMVITMVVVLRKHIFKKRTNNERDAHNSGDNTHQG